MESYIFGAPAPYGHPGIYAAPAEAHASGCSSFPIAFTIGVIVGALVALILYRSNWQVLWIVIVAAILGLLFGMWLCGKSFPDVTELFDDKHSSGSRGTCVLVATIVALLVSWALVGLLRGQQLGAPLLTSLTQQRA